MTEAPPGVAEASPGVTEALPGAAEALPVAAKALPRRYAGSVKQNVLPAFSSDSTLIAPPCDSITRFAR